MLLLISMDESYYKEKNSRLLFVDINNKAQPSTILFRKQSTAVIHTFWASMSIILLMAFNKWKQNSKQNDCLLMFFPVPLYHLVHRDGEKINIFKKNVITIFYSNSYSLSLSRSVEINSCSICIRNYVFFNNGQKLLT